MKNAIFSGNALVRLIKPSVFALFFAGSLNTASAQTTDKIKEVPVEVKYLGAVEGNPQFQIAFSNPQGEEVLVSLRDEDGYSIYSDVSKEKSYLRKIQFNDMNSEKAKLVLTLRTKRDTQTQVFEITRSTRIVQDIAVVSL